MYLDFLVAKRRNTELFIKFWDSAIYILLRLHISTTSRLCILAAKGQFKATHITRCTQVRQQTNICNNQTSNKIKVLMTMCIGWEDCKNCTSNLHICTHNTCRNVPASQDVLSLFFSFSSSSFQIFCHSRLTLGSPLTKQTEGIN